MLNTPFTPELTGLRIALQKHKTSPEYAGEFLALIKENRNHLLPWLQWTAAIKDQGSVISWLNDLNQKWKNFESANYGIFLDNALIGEIGIGFISYNSNRCDLGYWLDKKHTGKGYVKEAIQIIETEFFNRGMHRIEIRCDNTNPSSIAVAKSAGYKLDGILRQDHLYPEITDYRDTFVFSKLRIEWDEK